MKTELNASDRARKEYVDAWVKSNWTKAEAKCFCKDCLQTSPEALWGTVSPMYRKCPICLEVEKTPAKVSP